MFRLIRLAVLLVLAFMAGVFHERLQVRDACLTPDSFDTPGLCATQGTAHV